MTDFKAGDIVERIGGSYQDVVVGQTYIVQDAGNTYVKLQGCYGSYDPAMFKLHTQHVPDIDLNEDGWHIPVSNQAELEAAQDWLKAHGCVASPLGCDWPNGSTYLSNVSYGSKDEQIIRKYMMHGRRTAGGRKITLNFQKVVEVAGYTIEASETPAQKKLRELEESAALIQQQIAELKSQL